MFSRNLVQAGFCRHGHCRLGNIVRHSGDTATQLVDQVGGASDEQAVEFAAGQPEAVLHVGEEFFGVEGGQCLPQPEPLLQPGKTRGIEQTIKVRIAHQDDVGAIRRARICRCQRFELR